MPSRGWIDGLDIMERAKRKGRGDERLNIMNDKNGIESKALWAVDTKHRKVLSGLSIRGIGNKKIYFFPNCTGLVWDNEGLRCQILEAPEHTVGC
jgi:hypothetical protein